MLMFSKFLYVILYSEDSNRACVPSSNHHDNIIHIKLNEVNNLVGFQIKLDYVNGLDEWVGVANSATMTDFLIRNSFCVELHVAEFAKLVQ